MQKALGVDDFTMAYIVCALWSSTDDNDEPIDKNYNADDIEPDSLKEIEADCAQFQADNAELLSKAYETPGYNEESAGHDFWLTRNRHGAGFWDRGLGDIGDKLTSAAHVWGGIGIYIGDNGKLYFQ